MTTLQDIQTPNPSAVVELYTLDATHLGGSVYHFCPMTNYVGTNVVFGGTTYAALPITGSGWTKSTSGAAPRPIITVDNTQKVLQAAIISLGDIVTAKFTRVRVLARYLDAVNFVGGVNPNANPTEILSTETYLVDRKTGHNNVSVSWELVWPIDRPGFLLPRRQVLRTNGFPGIQLNTQ